MDPTANASNAEAPVGTTQQKRHTTNVVPEALTKRPPPRSNIKAATDLLLDQNRTGSQVDQPNKKRHYVPLKGQGLLDSLAELYCSFFKQKYQSFSRNVEKIDLKGLKAKDVYQLLAHTYISHWTQDVYRKIRDSLFDLDPVSYNEKYYTEVPVHSDVYDNLLATLCDHLKPTHITMSYADEILIPVLSKNVPDKTTNFFSWDKFYLNQDLFQIILQTLEDKKLCKLTPLSSDLLGRPFWLFDWSLDNQAYAWFPQEMNYSDEDVTLAYIVGVPCAPRLGHADYDDWKFIKQNPMEMSVSSAQLDEYSRVTKRRWKSSAEYRVMVHDSVHIPNFYETDKEKFKATMKGPLRVFDDPYAEVEQTAASSSTLDDSAYDADYVPESPRHYQTRSSLSAEQTKGYRVRVVDYMYYRRVIIKCDVTTRFAAFRAMIKY